MALLPFLTMSPIQAANFNQLTQGEDNQLDPRHVDAGPYLGKYVLPTRVIADPAYAGEVFQSAFAMLSQVAIETTEAWPPTDE